MHKQQGERERGSYRSVDLGLLEHPPLVERDDGEVLLAPDGETALADDRRGDGLGQWERQPGDAPLGRERRDGGVAVGGREDG